MATTTFEISGRPVGRVGYGAMQLPGPGVTGPPRDHDAAIAVLRRAVEAGVNHIDTAQYYGPNVANELIREALHPYPDDLVIVSKVGAVRDDAGGWHPAQTPAELRAGVEDNLRTLGVEQLARSTCAGCSSTTWSTSSGCRSPTSSPRWWRCARRARSPASGSPRRRSPRSTRRSAPRRSPASRTRTACSPATTGECSTGASPPGSRSSPTSPWARPSPACPRSPTTHGCRRSPPVSAPHRPRSGLAWLLARADNILLIPGTSSLAHLEENLAVRDLVLSAADQAELGDR